jgi:hypothetical protein
MNGPFIFSASFLKVLHTPADAARASLSPTASFHSRSKLNRRQAPEGQGQALGPTWFRSLRCNSSGSCPRALCAREPLCGSGGHRTLVPDFPKTQERIPMATFNKFNSFVEALAEKVHNLGSDTLKVALTNTAPNATDSQLSNITQISAGNGYTTGGAQATQVSSAQASGTYKLVLNDVTFTASGGSIATFRYVVLYNDTATNDELIGWYDYGTALTVTSGNSFTVDFDGTTGVLTLA